MLKKIFDSMSTGVVILDKEAKVKFFNKYMESFIKLENSSVKDLEKIFGNMFSCIYTQEENKKCGYTEHCPECPLRNSLEEVASEERVVVFEKEFFLNDIGGGKFFGLTMKPIVENGKKDVLLEVFEIRDKRIKEISKNYEEMKEKIGKYEEKSYKDSLTELYNRNFYVDKIEKIIFENNYLDQSLIILDLDNLKIINDTKGHQEGDVAIQELGRIVKSIMSLEGSYSIRFGGDEFMIFLPLNREETFKKAQELLEKVKESSKISSVSIGIAERKKDEELESLYRRADEALYIAKKNGKGTIVIGK